MAYYAVIQHMLDQEKNSQTLSKHVCYLDKLAKEGKIFCRGPFKDGSGGLIVYAVDGYEEALELAENDPHIVGQSRSYELKEWEILESDLNKKNKNN